MIHLKDDVIHPAFTKHRDFCLFLFWEMACHPDICNSFVLGKKAKSLEDFFLKKKTVLREKAFVLFENIVEFQGLSVLSMSA